MESLGSRTAVLGQPLCKFLLADYPGVGTHKRELKAVAEVAGKTFHKRLAVLIRTTCCAAAVTA
jgi:hypothetical protein